MLLASLILLVLSLENVAPDQQASAERPNLVWISCEDISPHLGCYGDEQATTPHLDQLARDGVRYRYAFATAGVCAPCRSAIISGIYQTTLGTQHMRCQATLPENILPFTVYLRESGYYCSNNSKKDYQFREPDNTWDESSGRAHWRRRTRPDQPFFSVFNFTECHESGIAQDAKYAQVTQGIQRHHPASLKSFPPYYPDTPAARADWGRYYDVVTAMDRRAGEVIAQLKEDGLYDDTIIVFWSDHGVGLPRAKRWLYDSGSRVPLIVRCPPRWRHWLPSDEGTWSDQLVSLLDLGPTMLKLAGVTIPDHMQGHPFLGADISERSYVYGARDRMDERYDIIRAVRDKQFKYIRNYEPTKTYYQYMNTPEKGRLMKEIRRVAELGQLSPAAALFLQPTKPTEELYDTHADPHELNNLADDPNYQEELRRLRAAHLQWVLDTRDLGLIPEPELVAREQRLGSRYAILRQADGEALIQRVRDAASHALAGEPGLKAMIEDLNADDAAVRYWGATGLGNLGRRARSARDQLVNRLDDEAAVVRVAAARALARLGEPARALPVLVKILEHGKQWERLQAVIVLDEMDEQARSVLGALQAARQPRNDLIYNGKYTVRVANRAVNELLGTREIVP